jgi:hypothetical protein
MFKPIITMDDSIELLSSEDSIAQVQSQLRTSAPKQNFICKQGLDDTKISTEDNNCNLTIIPSSPKLSPEQNEDKMTISQVSAHLKERLNFKSTVGVNGIVNGLGVGVDLSHTTQSEHPSVSNDKTQNSETPSNCDKCEKISIDCESTVIDYEPVSKCLDSHPDKLRRSSESFKCDDGVVSNVGTRNIEGGVKYVSYKSELQMPDIMRLIQKDLSEPYSIYTYRYFIHNWPKLCFLVGIFRVHSTSVKLSDLYIVAFSCVYPFTTGNGWQRMCWCHCMQVGCSSEGCETGLHSHVGCR